MARKPSPRGKSGADALRDAIRSRRAVMRGEAAPIAGESDHAQVERLAWGKPLQPEAKRAAKKSAKAKRAGAGGGKASRSTVSKRKGRA